MLKAQHNPRLLLKIIGLARSTFYYSRQAKEDHHAFDSVSSTFKRNGFTDYSHRPRLPLRACPLA